MKVLCVYSMTHLKMNVTCTILVMRDMARGQSLQFKRLNRWPDTARDHFQHYFDRITFNILF